MVKLDPASIIASVRLRSIRWPSPAPSEPAWDAFGHTVLVAFARLREIESAPRISGGKAGAKQVRDRLEARQRAWKLLDEWAEDRRLDGRPGDAGSMTQVQVAAHPAVFNGNIRATKGKS